MKYNYVLIEESPDYLQYFFRGFTNHKQRQFLQMESVSFIADIRDLNIKNFYNGCPYCYIIGGRIYEYYGNYLISYLRTNYRGCKIVLELIDLVKNYTFEVGNFKEWFDFVIVFDARDAKKYNLKYMPITFEYSSVKPCDSKSDFFFVGGENQYKGRFEKIMKLYHILSERGYQCDFWLADVPEKLQEKSSGINYGYLPFYEVLSHTESTKCIVELVQNEMFSPTVRLIESILYGKHLLTDVETIGDDDVYKEYKRHVHILSDNMDFSFINEKVQYDIARARILFSNDSFIKAIEKLLC